MVSFSGIESSNLHKIFIFFSSTLSKDICAPRIDGIADFQDVQDYGNTK